MKTCELCNKEFNSHSCVCDQCAESNLFINTKSAIYKYKLHKNDVQKIKSYYLRNKFYGENGMLDNYFCGKYFLVSDIEKHIKNDTVYLQRTSVMHEREYLNEMQLKKERDDAVESQQSRINFITAVFNKIGYTGSIYLSNDINTYIWYGYIGNKNMKEFEIYLINLVKKINVTEKSKNNISEKNESEQKKRIDLIKTVLHLDYEYLQYDDIYNIFIEKGIDGVKKIDYSLDTLDKIISYFLEYYEYAE